MKKKESPFMSIRIPADLKEMVREQAKKDERTLTGQILFYVRQCVEKEMLKKK